MADTCRRGHRLADTGYQRRDRPGMRCRACETANRRLRRRSAGMQPKPLTPAQVKAKADAEAYLANEPDRRWRHLLNHIKDPKVDLDQDFDPDEQDHEVKPRPWDPGTLVQPGHSSGRT
jgi:hypothetical protein